MFQIWSVLRVYPYHMRYRLYGQWKSETFSQHPLLMKKKADIQKSIKRIVQRISKENVKPTSRALAKLSHSAPGLLFDCVLTQIQMVRQAPGTPCKTEQVARVSVPEVDIRDQIVGLVVEISHHSNMLIVCLIRTQEIVLSYKSYSVKVQGKQLRLILRAGGRSACPR